jgi:hypothetical protein
MISTLSIVVFTVIATPPKPTVSLPVNGCKNVSEVAIYVSPHRPHKKAPLRIMITRDEGGGNGYIQVRHPDGTEERLDTVKTGGPPWGYAAEVPNPAPGKWRVGMVDSGVVLGCKRIKVHSVRWSVRRQRTLEEDSVWTAYRRWTRHTENLFSLWIERLFAAPVESEPTWPAMHELVRNPQRNLLHDHLGMGEDTLGKRAQTLKPDCADFPYFLRAYFSWKLGLPFGYRHCGQGRKRKVAGCGDLKGNDAITERENPISAFYRFVHRHLKWGVQSANGRTAHGANNTDFYPIPLNRPSIRPGTIFADPYGHLLVVSQFVPPQDNRSGILFAVDAQPDATVGRRRFWRGSFLFPDKSGELGAGFKRFRPIIQYKDRQVALRNKRITTHRSYGDFSEMQMTLGSDAFYDHLSALITPTPLPPLIAFRAELDALAEQVRRRVLSVQTCETWKTKNTDRVIDMPEDRNIFQTAGPWEDFSTPSRDMRLLIAIDTVIQFPEQITRTPDRYQIPKNRSADEVRVELAEKLLDEASKHRFEYKRTDGSSHSLSVADIIGRRKMLEMAYNPNDCPEIRWGAPDGSNELTTCVRRAPTEQRERMKTLRSWFEHRQRPTGR